MEDMDIIHQETVIQITVIPRMDVVGIITQEDVPMVNHAEPLEEGDDACLILKLNSLV